MLDLKKVVITGMAGLMILGLTGCHKREYEYQLSDFCEVSFLGENGSGYIEIHQKEVDKSGFDENELEKYETLVYDLKNINMNYISGNQNNSRDIAVSKDKELSNGDEIKIDFKKKPRDFHADIGNEPLIVTVEGLADSLEEVDLFDEKYVTFSGNPETNTIVSVIKTPAENVELSEVEKEYLGYFMKYGIISQNAVEKNSAFVAKAELAENAVNLYGYEDLNVFLAHLGMKTAADTKEMTLSNIQETIHTDDPDSIADKEAMKNAINEAFLNFGQGAIHCTDIVGLRNNPSLENGFFVYYYIDDGVNIDYYETAIFVYYTNGTYSAELGNYSRPVTYEQAKKYIDKGTPLSDNMPKEHEAPETEGGE